MDDFVLVDDLAFKPHQPQSTASGAASTSHYDDMFDSYFNSFAEPPKSSPSSPPVYDKPVFDDEPGAADPLDAVPLFGDAPGSGGSDRGNDGEGDDFLDSLGKPKPAREAEAKSETVGFDGDLIPGFGGSTSRGNSTREQSGTSQGKESMSSSPSPSIPEDPFVILGTPSNPEYSSFGLFTDHLDNMGMPTKSESTKVDIPSNAGGMFEDSDIFGGIPKSMPAFSFAPVKESDVGNDSRSHSNLTSHQEPIRRASAGAFGVLPDMHFSKSSNFNETPGSSDFEASESLTRNMQNQAPKENKYPEMPNDVWLTVSDIILVTRPTSAPPPARLPPPLATKQQPTKFNTSSTRVHHTSQSYDSSGGSTNILKTSQFDELEDFAMAKPAKFSNAHSQVLTDKGIGKDSSRAAMGFMDWAGVKHSEGLNKGNFDSLFTGTSAYQQHEINEKTKFYSYDVENKEDEEKLDHEQKQREKEEEQRRRDREREELEREREKAKKKEEEERKTREKEKEARQAVEKAVREARERAAAEARMQAEREARQRAERAAVQKVAAEARERAAAEARERASKAAAEARDRAAAEARERAAAEARERAAKVAAAEARERAAAEARESAAKAAAEARERAAAEAQEKSAAESRAKAERAAVEKATAEARRRAERAAVERAAAEARQRAAKEARDRAAAEAQARQNQQRAAEPDLESIFGMPSRSNSVPRPQTATTNPFDVQPPASAGSGVVRRTSSGSAATVSQPSSNNLMDDLSSIFGAPSSSAVFQEVEGESEERRKIRLERHQRTMERAAQALAEKNNRDLQLQQEQEEKHRISGALDFEIKRWAAGKECNLRALLSTLQYILWPECGWRPVSLTNLITAASVKKEYRKATLCIHPDKVQQKGANLQQKYIAEKVFDLLKEAWNKFNSEELF